MFLDRFRRRTLRTRSSAQGVVGRSGRSTVGSLLVGVSDLLRSLVAATIDVGVLLAAHAAVAAILTA